MRIAAVPIFALVVLAGLPLDQARGQSFGIGINTMATTGRDPIGLGLDMRAAFPVNADFSVVGGLTLTGFVFKGREESAYFLSPSASAILTMSATEVRSMYIIGGLGGYFPLANEDRNDEAGPAIHAGLGWSSVLQATAVYLEVTPTLVVARSSAGLLLPVRVGVIL